MNSESVPQSAQLSLLQGSIQNWNHESMTTKRNVVNPIVITSIIFGWLVKLISGKMDGVLVVALLGIPYDPYVSKT